MLTTGTGAAIITRKLWAEDINRIGLELIDSYPPVTMNDEDHDVFFEHLERLLDPYCDGYQNYN